MASTYAFQPYGLSQAVTVIATATTVSFTITRLGGATAAVTNGNLYANGIRLINVGTVAASVQFGPPPSATTGGTATASLTTGMWLPANAVEKFSIRGTPIAVFISAGTCTVYATLGEGM